MVAQLQFKRLRHVRRRGSGLPRFEGSGGSVRLTHTQKKPCKSAQADDRPCLECACCKWWLKHTGIAKAIDDAKYDGHDRGVQHDTVTAKVSELSEQAQASVKLTAEKEKLVSDNKQYKKTINELRAKSNGIKTTTAVDRPEKGTNPPGRPKGCKATINKRPENIDREEVLDGTDCPDCGGPLAETSPETIDKVVTMVRVIKENVLYKRRRRWCKNCKKLQAPSIPDVQKYARRSSNHTALTVSLNMNGMSHARAARHSKDVIKLDMSRSAAYRDKLSHAKQQEPFHAQIRQNVLAEPALGCDEFCTTVPRDKSKDGDNAKGVKAPEPDGKADDTGKKSKCTQERRGLIALGKDNCLIEIAHNRRIGTLEKFLPDYSGLVIQDSYAGWLHIGNMRQLCMSHQICIVKEDIKYGNHKGDVLKFLQQLLWIL